MKVYYVTREQNQFVVESLSDNDSSPSLAESRAWGNSAAAWGRAEHLAGSDAIRTVMPDWAAGVLADSMEIDDIPRVCYLRDDTISRAASALGRRGGQSTSEAKRAASRVNGRKGGRPRMQKNVE